MEHCNPKASLDHNPIFKVSRSEVLTWLNTLVTKAGFDGNSILSVRIDVQRPFIADKLSHYEVPNLIVIAAAKKVQDEADQTEVVQEKGTPA